MLKGFREFILRGNVIDLAVAVVIGAAFTGFVNSIVTGIFNPLIGALFKADSLNSIAVIHIGDAKILLGSVLGAIIQFLIVAVVVYFVFVFPINLAKEHAQKRRDTGLVDADTPVTELALLPQIRDLLAKDQTPAGGRHTPDA